MGLHQAATALKERLSEAADQLPLPTRCVFCDGVRVGWKQRRCRTATVLCEGQAEYVPEIPTPRVICRGCNRSWTLQPPGLLSRKHYQPCVVAQATADYLFDPSATQQAVADQYGCCRQQVGRWLSWMSELASPGQLQARLVEASGEPVHLPPPEVADLDRKAATEAGRGRLVRAALVLVLLEAVGAALCLEPPGLRAVLLRLSEGWRPVAPLAAPALPIVAQRQALLGFASIAM